MTLKKLVIKTLNIDDDSVNGLYETETGEIEIGTTGNTKNVSATLWHEFIHKLLYEEIEPKKQTSYLWDHIAYDLEEFLFGLTQYDFGINYKARREIAREEKIMKKGIKEGWINIGDIK